MRDKLGVTDYINPLHAHSTRGNEMKKELKCQLTRATKNQIIYGAEEITALYIKKASFEGDVPNEITVNLEW